MDSAAAYGMMVPDDGGPRWAGFPFVARCVVSHEDGRTRFSVFKIRGTGLLSFDFGDGSTLDFDCGPTESVHVGAVVDGFVAPVVQHEYAEDGSFIVTVRGALSGIRLSSTASDTTNLHYPVVPDVNSLSVDTSSALHDVLRAAITIGRHDMVAMYNVETAVLDPDVIGWQYPILDGSGPVMENGPRRLIVRRWTRQDGLTVAYYRTSTLALLRLEEFYAPNINKFVQSEHPYNPPFAVCDRLRLVYVPSMSAIASRRFVSPKARGVKLYVGRLTSIHQGAFGPYEGELSAAIDVDFPLDMDERGDVELFCQNTRQEILNFPGYPFGAEYLKCHCTDITFDNEGRFWRNSDGRRVDEYGQLVDDEGRFIDEAGHRIEQDGNGEWRWVDPYGRWVDRLDRPIDLETGFLVDSDGHVCDEHGRKCDVLGRLLSGDRYWDGEWKDAAGMQVVVDRTSTVVGSPRLLVSDVGEQDPRLGTFRDSGTDGYEYDYFDSDGYMRAREMLDGTLYSIEYPGDGSWYPVLLSRPEDSE